MSILPSGYKKLDYIESTGTQFIRTDIYPLSNDIIEIRGNFTDITKSQTMVGSHNSGHYRKAFGCTVINGENKFISTAGVWNENTVIPGWAHSGTPVRTSDTDIHTFIFNQADNSLTIDSIRYPLQNGENVAPGSSQERFKMVLFAYCHDTVDQIYNRSNFKLYYAKFYSNSILVRDYQPALRISDLKPGLYDFVSNTFFVNDSTTGDDFKYSISTYNTYIFDRYEELSWIKSTGSQYVNVGNFNGLLKIEVDGILHPQIVPPGADSGLYSAVGTANYGGSSTSAQMIAISASQANHIMLRVNGVWVSSGINSYERHIIDLEQLQNSTTLSVDGITTNTVSQTFNTNGKDIYYFGIYHCASSTIYGGKISVNGTQVRNFIPVYDLVEQKYGLFDTLGLSFYPFNTNEGLTCERIPSRQNRFVHRSYQTNILDNNLYTHSSYKTNLAIGE